MGNQSASGNKRKRDPESDQELESDRLSHPILSSYPEGTGIYDVRNADRTRVDNLRHVFASRQDYVQLSMKRDKESFDRRKEALIKSGVYSHMVQYPIHCKTAEGSIFSNILMGCLVDAIKNEHIHYSLFTPTYIQPMNFTNKRKSDDMPPNPHVDVNMKVFKKTIEAWIARSGIREAFDLGSNVRVIRSGFLFQFNEYYQNKTEGGHAIFLCATKTRDDAIHFHIVDNLDPNYYYEHAHGGKSIIDVCHDYITEIGHSKFSVHFVRNQLPSCVPPAYSCMSSARRAAMYAAIVEDFGHVDSWYEVANSALYNHNMNLYMHHMNRMLNWFFEEENFWKAEGPWGLLHPHPFYITRSGTFMGDVLVARLTPFMAYVMVVKSKGVNELYFFRGDGDVAFVPSDCERKGTCTVSSCSSQARATTPCASLYRQVSIKF